MAKAKPIVALHRGDGRHLPRVHRIGSGPALALRQIGTYQCRFITGWALFENAVHHSVVS